MCQKSRWAPASGASTAAGAALLQALLLLPQAERQQAQVTLGESWRVHDGGKMTIRTTRTWVKGQGRSPSPKGWCWPVEKQEGGRWDQRAPASLGRPRACGARLLGALQAG